MPRVSRSVRKNQRQQEKSIMKKKKKQYKSVIMARIFQSMRKVGVAVLALVCASSIFTVGRTNAGFFDVEESHDNQWVAGSLDGRVTYAARFNVTGMNPAETPNGRIIFTNEGSLDFRYDVKFRKTNGSNLLCQALQVIAKRDGSTVYTGALADFKLLGGKYVLTPFESDTWDMVLSLPSSAGSELEHLTCEWDVDFLAWQTNLPSATDGFFDEESVTPNSVNTDEWLTPGDVIINEVMWMGSDGETSDEWIELKNMTARDINLSNWNIKQGGTGTGVGAHIEIPSGYSIKANSYFLITKKKWNETAIALTSDLAKSKGYTHVAGMKLEDEGEELVLENKDAMVIDRTPLGGWPAGTNDELKQSMERNDVPGDGSLAANWHTCVSGAANGAPYWDMAGINFGTPLAANLSPIVMNEFVANPLGDDAADGADGEWIELYNIVDDDIDVANWYFTNHDGDSISISADRTEGGSTVVPGHGTLVVYLNTNFLDNDSETLALYAPHDLDILTDDVREDVVQYDNANLLPEGKSFARFPDGIGVWIDPETTPGADNALTDEERTQYQLEAYETCFAGEELIETTTENMCSPLFLEFIGLIQAWDETTIDGGAFLDILEQVRVQETEELLSLVQEDGIVTPEEEVLITFPDIPTEDVTPIDEEELDTETDETMPAAVEEEVAEPQTVPAEITGTETDILNVPEEPVSEELTNSPATPLETSEFETETPMTEPAPEAPVPII
ncbi:MAG: hypothetical protein E6P95_03340 [Candidatus Moraniibacteriota bacterium]|nr:MAG: hypothetical protein E6P95_03340 [Candidatus Moranbacteria bacterium]